MSFWESVKGVFIRPAEDVKDGLKDFGENLDEALAKKEEELAASPAERFDMALEEADATNRHLDELVAQAEHSGDAEGDTITETMPPLVSDLPAHDTPGAQHPSAPHQLLEAADVSSSPHLDLAMKWVTVEPTQEADPMCQRCGHAAWLDERAIALVGEDQLGRVASTVAGHPLVSEAILDDLEVLYVAAPALHHEDVRLLVAGALTDRIPDGWQATSPPDLSG